MSDEPNTASITPPTPAAAENGNNRTAAQERVTSAELTQAMARIEARREKEAQRLELAVTPEELLAEVESLRRNTHQSVPKPVAEPFPNVTPAESSQNEAAPLTHCPACSRKLLTQASALCNWCGAKISDPQYQERAARSRQDLDRTELSQLETLVQEEARYGIFGRLKRRAKQSPGNKNTLG